MKRIAMTAMILLTLILSLTGCADHVQTFEKYVREGNYSEAIHLYQDKLMDDVENYAVCQEQVQAYLDETLAAYAAGELPRGQMENVMTTMEMLEDYLYLVDGLEDGHTLFSRLKNSKDTFHEAEQYRQNGQYELAMETYSDVLPEDTEYYSAARENMEEMIRQIVEEERNAVIQAYESGDYPGVFQAYHAVENSRYGTVTEDLTEIRQAAAMEYLRIAAQQAEEVFGGSAKDYNAAMESLRIARAAVEAEADLVAELEAMSEEYRAYIPVLLRDMRPVQRGSYVDVGSVSSRTCKDISGNTYHNKGVIFPTGDLSYTGVADSDGEAGVVYNLNYAYSTFKATVYLPYIYLSCDQQMAPGTACVRIYGDDVLLYEFLDPGEYWDTFDIEVDVSGVRNMKIVVRGCWEAGDGTLGANWKAAICMAEGVLQK